MKTKFLPIVLVGLGCFFMAAALEAQPPQSFHYQAVIRDNTGEIIANQLVGLRISILRGSETGLTAYQETHQLNSNAQGLLNLVIGTGTTSDDFSQIDWSNGPYFLKLEADPAGGTSYVFMGTSQLQSVPYALHAGIPELQLNGNTLSIVGGNSVDIPTTGANYWTKNADTVYRTIGNIGIGTATPGGRLSVQGDDDLNQDKALFEVKRKDGQPVFAVFPDGVEVYVDDAAAKGAKGGFAVAGFGGNKATVNEYLRVSPDSVRVYIDETTAKGAKGGFAIGGLGKTKGPDNNFMSITPENYFIGQQSGRSITTGQYNSFMGYQSGFSTTIGDQNIFLGFQSGYGNIDGYANTFIGNTAGYGNLDGYSNVFIGDSSGFSNTTGRWNIFLGNQTGYHNIDGDANIVIGDLAGYFLESGFNNVLIGDLAGAFNDVGDYNVFVGASAGFYNDSGSYNVFLGDAAGYNNTSGSYNVFLGQGAGEDNTEGESNVFLGTEAGSSNNLGDYNVFIGDQAGFSNTEGFTNVFIGANSGIANTTGDFNVFIGDSSGASNDYGRSNVFMGLKAGQDNYDGNFNVFMGTWAGKHNISGEQNVFLGQQAGEFNEFGNYNVSMGVLAGAENDGDQNLFLGYRAAEYNDTGDYNVAIGPFAGQNNNGDWNVFLGYAAGYNGFGSGGQTSNMLWIDNAASTWDQTLIYGEFSNDFLRFYANTEVAGDLTYLGSFGFSDKNLKDNIEPLEGALDDIKQLNGISFDWKKDSKHGDLMPEGRQIGLIAQDVEQVFPDMVKTTKTGEKAVNYTQLTTVLIEAVKEQQQMIEELQAEVEALKAKIPE